MTCFMPPFAHASSTAPTASLTHAACRCPSPASAPTASSNNHHAHKYSPSWLRPRAGPGGCEGLGIDEREVVRMLDPIIALPIADGKLRIVASPGRSWRPRCRNRKQLHKGAARGVAGIKNDEVVRAVRIVP